jgi:GTP-binding protein
LRTQHRATSGFIDIVEILVAAGNGGDGCVSFRREKFVPRGGPDGGNGGRGGDVVVDADPHLSTLIDYKYKRIVKGGRGSHGKGKNQHGKDGEVAVVRVPVGTVARDALTGEVLGDLIEPGTLVVARGGRGGRGNAVFATSTDQAPRRREEGRPGEERRLVLEVKLIADVGIVGEPNVGKSSLLKMLTKARPKIGAYPFTTLSPNLGVLRYHERDMVLADIPGLIEGAHLGKGLGHEFLRHIERTRMLLLLLDAASADPAAALAGLRSELALYSPALEAKPCVVCLNKADLVPPEERAPLATRFGALVVSAATGFGLRVLVTTLFDRLAKIEEEDEDGVGKRS